MKFIAYIPAFLAGGALAVLVILTVLSVVARYLFGLPFHWLEEVSGLLMIWIVMAGAVVCERHAQHLTISMLTDALPLRFRAFIELIVALLSIAILVYLTWLGLLLSLGARDKLTDILGMSWFWIDLAVPAGAGGIAVSMLLSLKEPFTILFGPQPDCDKSSTGGCKQ